MNTTAWPADRVERRDVASLIPYARNARTHSDAQVAQIAASIAEWGWTTPVLVDGDGILIAGHGRVLAAQKLGIAEVPVMVATGWTKAQIAAYRLADNKLALNAGWDNEQLKIELGELDLDGFDLPLIGFGPDELAGLLDTTEGLTDPDDVPEVQPDAVVTVPGDVWVLGRHRLLCGDSTDADAVEAVLAGVRPHLMVTDPPYGVEYDASWRNEAGASINGTTQRVTSGKVTRQNNTRAVGKVSNDDRADWSEAWALFPGDVAYVWCASLHIDTAAASLRATEFELRSSIIWVKQHFAIGRGDYHWQHEPCWYAVRKGSAGHWAGDRKQTTVWQITNNTFQGGKHGPEDAKTNHSTQKPVECMKRPIENNSSPGQAVYEPFSGSGTTIIAAEMTGRCCHAIELAPQYVDVAVRRWEAFTGQQATHEATGRTFAETANFPLINGPDEQSQAPADDRAA